LSSNPELLFEFKELLSSTCTFVDDWNNELITPTTYRLFGGKILPEKHLRNIFNKFRISFPKMN